MTPLDLRACAPRSSHVAIDRIAYLARAVDKLRAMLPGGNIGPYVVVRADMPTVNSMFYYRTGIDHDRLIAIVASAETDDDVAAWVRANSSAEAIEKWNRQILNTKLSDLPADALQRVYGAHPGSASMPLDTLLIDVFDADDALMFA